MSKKPMSASTMKFLEARKEIERQHLEYLRETRAKYLEERDRVAVYDFATGTALYDGPKYVWDSGPTTTIKYLTLEEAMKLHREAEARKYYTAKPGSRADWYPSTWVETSPVVHVQKNIRVAGLSDGTYPEVGMRVMHDGVTFEIERIEIETPSWRPIAVGHAVGDTDTFTAGRLYVRAPLDELQPAKAKEKDA